jgi:predicted DNA-binding ribbon-helix-helix protein
MTALTIRLPNSVHESIKALARKDGISVNQFIASAAAEKMASFQTLDYLRREAAQGKREDFEKFLKLVPDVPAQAGDALSPDTKLPLKT